MGGPHHGNGDTNPDISACPGVGFPPLDGEADGKPFHSGLYLGTLQSVCIYDKGGKVSALIKESVQLLTFFSFSVVRRIFYGILIT